MDIAAWLGSLGLERYEPAFRENEIDAGVLPELTDPDLTALGLPIGPRRKLLKAIASLRGPLPAPGPDPGIAAGRAKTKRQLYWAYGSNLNLSHMARRCPGAVPLAAVAVGGLVLRFRRVADVEPLVGAVCSGGLWLITDECAEALDRYEGVGSGLYERRFMGIEYNGKVLRCLYYRMRAGGIAPPAESYFRTIAGGYRDFGLELSFLRRAVEDASECSDKAPMGND
jgi:hypothetical protein